MSGAQIVPLDERSSESCSPCESSDLTQEHVEGQEKVDLADSAANLEDAGTWYYVVDCATCQAVIPFKYAPEDEPILRFPIMTVRCFHCHTDHSYAPDLISHRKAAAPRGIPQRDRPSSDAGDGDQEASRDRQEGRGSEGGVIVEREIEYSLLRRANILIAAVSGKRAAIFFLSSCFFAAAWVSQLALQIFHPARSSGPEMLLSIGYFLGLLLFIFGMASFFVEACGFKHKIDELVLRLVSSSLAASSIVVPRTGVPRKDRSD